MTYVKGSLWLLGRKKPEGGQKHGGACEKSRREAEGLPGQAVVQLRDTAGWLDVANKELASYADGENVKCERKRVIRKISSEWSFHLLKLGRWR